MDNYRNEVMANIRSVLISIPGAITINRLQADYTKLVGSHIPYEKLGYKQLQAFLMDEPTLCVTRHKKEVYVDARPNQKTAHISHLVAFQNNKSKGGVNTQKHCRPCKPKKPKNSTTNSCNTNTTIPSLPNQPSSAEYNLNNSKLSQTTCSLTNYAPLKLQVQTNQSSISSSTVNSQETPSLDLFLNHKQLCNADKHASEVNQSTVRHNSGGPNVSNVDNNGYQLNLTNATSEYHGELYENGSNAHATGVSDRTNQSQMRNPTVEDDEVKTQLSHLQEFTNSLKILLHEHDIKCLRAQTNSICTNLQFIAEKIHNLYFDASNKRFESPNEREVKNLPNTFKTPCQDPYIVSKAQDYLQDECVAYGQYVANKLKNYNDRERATAQHHMSNVLFNIDMSKNSSTVQHCESNTKFSPSNSANILSQRPTFKVDQPLLVQQAFNVGDPQRNEITTSRD